MQNLFNFLLCALLLSSCSSSRLVDEYTNAESPNFQAKKVLVVGLIPDIDMQRQFEYSLVKALEAKNVVAERSVDYFDTPAIEIDQSEENLANLEKELLNAGFDAVIFSKVTGQENKVTIVQSYRNLTKSFETFSAYYSENKAVYNNAFSEDYAVYNTETSLYCLCPGEERDLIWRAKINIVDPPAIAATIRDYVKTLVKTLKKNSLLITE